MTVLQRLSRFPLIFAVLIFVGTLIAYSRSLMPGTVGGDAGELQYAGPLLALVHPTGQPLYVLIGKAWTEFWHLRSAAYEMNLLAAISTAAGCGLITYFLTRLYGSFWIGAVTGLTLGFGGTIWGQAVLADKYGFNVFLATLIIGLTLWWDHTHRTHKEHSNPILYGLCIAFAIGLLHHRSLVLFAPGIAVVVIYHLKAELWRNWQRTLICIALVLLPPLLIYSTVLPALRANAATPLLWQPQSTSDWINFLLERHVLSGEALVFDDSRAIGEQVGIYLDTLFNDYTLVVFIIGVFGMIGLFREARTAAAFLLMSYFLQAFLSANFRGNDRQFTYYLPSFVTLLYGYGYGLCIIWFWWRRWIDQSSHKTLLIGLRSVVPIIGIAAIFALPIYTFSETYPDKRTEAIYGEPLDIWRTTLKTGNQGERLTAGMQYLPENAVLASDWEQVTMLWYKQQVEGVRPDLEILYPIERYADYIETEREICLARHIPVGEEWYPSNVGALVCLWREPLTETPRNMIPVGQTLIDLAGTEILELTGYVSDLPVYPAGTHAPVTIIWRALTDVEKDYSISLQILDESWNLIYSKDIQSPVMGMYPTSRWHEGQLVNDYHEIDIPREMPPGRYLWTVVVYRGSEDGSFERLRDSAGGTNILGGVFEVTAR